MTQTHPEFLSKLNAVEDLEAQLTMLATRQAALEVSRDEAQAKVRQAYRDRHAPKFADMDVTKALAGAKVEHAMPIKGVATFYLRPPARALAAQIAAMKDVPMDDTERFCLAWIVGLHLTAQEGTTRIDLTAMELPKRLERLRAIPEVTLARVAEEADTLHAYLKVVLEAELGN